MTTVLEPAFTKVSGLQPIEKWCPSNTLLQNSYLMDICITHAQSC